MIRGVQKALLGLYAAAKAAGLLESALGQRVLHGAYFTYKSLLEPRPDALRQFVPPGAWVIDVGANIGFYTRLFAGWVGAGGRVVALEPEAANYRALGRVVERAPAGAVMAVQAVAADVDGTLHLRLNPDSHADHRIAADGVPTESVQLDTLLARLGGPRVGLLKIDVQGAEPRVLAGSSRLLREQRPAVYMEVDDAALRDAGSSAHELLAFMDAHGYAPHEVHRTRITPALARAQCDASMRRLGYADFLFLPRATATQATTT